MDEDEWKSLAEQCLKARGKLYTNEEEFLESILDQWDGELTEKQEDWLNKIAGRLGVE